MVYTISKEKRRGFISMVLLNEIINFQTYFPVQGEGSDVYLSEYLAWMKQKGFLLVNEGQYVPTPVGREELLKLYSKYQEYLKMYDLYCAVDLANGEFAFSRMNDYDETQDDQWHALLEEERFSDVRVAVADFKKIDPLEMVFLSFLNEGKFDCTANNWEYNLTTDAIWNEIEMICSTAVSAEYLREDDVLENVIRAGSALALEMIAAAEQVDDEPTHLEDEQTEEIVETTTTTTEEVEEYVDVVEMPDYRYDYYQPYRDPFYVSPVWVAVALWY